MNKRTYDDHSDTPLIRIKLAVESDYVEADKRVVQLFSGLAGEMPDSDEWDLTTFLIDGKPVQRRVVVAWLNAAYSMVYRSSFEQQQEHPASSMEGLYQLLTFADAIKSPKGLLESCVSELGSLMLCVTEAGHLAGSQQELYTDGTPYMFRPTLLDLAYGGPKGTIKLFSFPGDEEKLAFTKEVAKQTEQLLFMAYKLQLAPLISRLHTFLRSAVMYAGGLLSDREHDVFSERVLDVAVGFNKVGRHAYVTSVLCGEQWSLARRIADSPFTFTPLMKPLDLTKQQKQPIEFKAELQQDYLGMPKGSVLPVKLDLFGESKATIGAFKMKVTLCTPAPTANLKF